MVSVYTKGIWPCLYNNGSFRVGVWHGCGLGVASNWAYGLECIIMAHLYWGCDIGKASKWVYGLSMYGLVCIIIAHL